MVDNTSPGERAWAEGIAIFAGTVLATVGVFQFLEGLSAVAKDDVLVKTPNYLWDFDVTTWGWVHMVIGALAVLIGVCLLLGQYWAMIAGICIAVVSAFSNFAFLPFYPFWAMAIIAFDLAVIWAMAVLMGQRR
ncbi:MAG TPA: hypothetical protein VFT70_03125 [Nocardioides sp.]|nr:hypothetical protein [Nocardioides sp.]